MITTALIAVGSLVVGVLIGAMIMAVLNVSHTSDADSEHMATIAALKKQLTACRQMSEEQRVKAETYYDLYCDGAKANAVLRRAQ